MKYIVILTAICMAQIISSCSRKDISLPPIIPKPNYMGKTKGVFNLKNHQVIYYQPDSLKESAGLLADILNGSGNSFIVRDDYRVNKKGIIIKMSDNKKDRSDSFEIQISKMFPGILCLLTLSKSTSIIYFYLSLTTFTGTRRLWTSMSSIGVCEKNHI
jgi:hypothetical protein